MNKTWKMLDSELLHNGWFRLERLHFEHELFAGGSTGPVNREFYERGNVAAVLPYDRSSDSVVLVEQFRIGAKDDPDGPWLIEVVAGMIEANEQPEEMAHREAREEAGITLDKLIPMLNYYASPGATDERVHLYCALADLSQAGGVHGLADEHEDIRVLKVSADEAIALLHNGTIRNAISVIAIQWLALNLHRLRQGEFD